jgi:prepilin-type N-terminal cleavage/methylation domain-containing protein
MKNRGFTLVEVALTIAAISSIAGISIPIYQAFQVRNDLDIATVEIVQTLRRAQLLSQMSDGDMRWGVSIQSGSITLFKGTSYAVRDSNFDEVFDVPISITPSGHAEIVFTKFTGIPQSTGTTTLTSSIYETRNITINAQGIVNY